MTEDIQVLSKYNFWDQKPIKQGMIRKFYLDSIKGYFNNNLIKVLMGQRRAGKSYVLRQIIESFMKQGVHPKNIFYLNKELIEFDFVKNYSDLYQLIEAYKKELKPKGKIFVFLDEIQEIDGWEKLVNSLAQDYKDDYEVYLSDSNSKMLSSELATLLSGRYVSFTIFPFSYPEFLQFYKKENNKNSFLDYLKTGGLPELYNLPSDEVKRHYLSSLKDTIIVKDIADKHRVRDVALLSSLFDFLADNSGKLFSINSIVGYLNKNKYSTNHETISNYLVYLQEAFLIHRADRYNVRGKKILSKECKYFINDLSFRNYLSSGFEANVPGKLENVVYLDYLRKGYNLYIGKIGGNEIDFVLEKNNLKKYLQITYLLSSKEVIEREFGNLEMIKDFYEKKVLSMDDISFGNRNGIWHEQIWEELGESNVENKKI